MKHDWKQHIFSNVFDLQMGKTPDRKSPELFEGDNVWVTISDLDGVNISSSKEHISDEAASKIKIVKKGTVIMSFKLSVGKAAIASKDLYTNEAIMAFNVNDGYDINNKFLYYYLSGYNWEGGNRAVMGVTLNKATISKQIISLPPLPTQQSIVSELDSLSKIIVDCKETLKDYDALEQSIFYDMFGDPVKNDKGWEVKKIEDVYSLKAGKTIKANELSEEPSEGLYPCFGGNGIRGYIAKKSHCGSYPIIGRQGALCGNVNFAEGEFYATEHAVVVSNKIECNPLFSYFLLTNMKLERLAKGVAQPGLSVASVNEENSILPPLPLQQQFASKIEAIEKMKSETKKALQEAETLFNARMDYWFN